ncbi:hypothetical protein TNCV_3789021 [Trichonephila clavipes]|nr:hypothetical protein TNCV_3789021 [Trichonephila clavipes]
MASASSLPPTYLGARERDRKTLAGLKLAILKRRWFDGYKLYESGLPVMEPTPNKLYYHQKGCHRALISSQDCYVALSARRHRRTTAPQLARDLVAGSGRRISKQTVNSRHA